MICLALRPILENFANFVVPDESVFVLSSEENVVVFKIRRTTAAPVTCMVMR